MSAPDQESKPAATPLDAEREQLRKAGYTDAEVSQILIARAASQHPAGVAQGVMSNVLSSLLGVASHARAVIPSFRKDVATMFDETFVRAWRLYLAGSQAAFTTGTMQLFQVVFARGTNNAIPWTRVG